MAVFVPNEPSQAYRIPTQQGLYELVGVEHGPPAMRRDKDIVRDQAEIAWELVGAVEYNNFMSRYLNARDDDWNIQLPSPIGGYDRYLCRLIPNTFALTSNSGEVYTVAGRFEILGVAP